ncbi:cache domain-containing sensor histidine kinase [Streptococcus pacificus]|uniref:Sensor histidine kinase n=1 Tax=Streptococcus pacificus TaxID=2740577 RepID=A0ABS0ZJJ0_9STRE|nr:sensor histidine kinase [Streptococcus pacificus]MBJ8326136.1 sensor histidine kinase [Streptococcus pacificus]
MKRYPLLVQLVIYVFIIVFVLLVTVGGLYYQTSSSAIRQTTEQNTRDTLNQGQQFISTYLQKLQQTTNSLATNQELKDYALEADSRKKEDLNQLFQTILETDKDFVSIIFVGKNGDTISTNEDLVMATSDDMMKESWYQEAIHQNGMPVLMPFRKMSDVSNEEWVISITQEVIDDKGQNLGVLRLDTGYETLETYLDQLKLGSSGFTFIVNDQKDFIYHPQKSVYSSKEEMDEMTPFITQKDGYTKDNHYFVYQLPVSDSQWTLIGVASLDSLQMIQKQILLSFVGIGLLTVIISGFAMWFILKLWLQPIRDLQAIILAIGQGNAHLRAAEKGSPELVQLSHQFNNMLDRIDSLMIAIKEKEQDIRRFELEALASQINPHFLYNTLDTIVWMAEFNDSEKVVEITKSLAKYFRLALNKGNEKIALTDELEHVKQYLFIQKQRYGDKLSYEISSIEAYSDYQLPKLILQPLVENAIYHGIKEVNRPGLIKISVTETENHLVVSIYDNGKGMVATAPSSEGSQTKLSRGGVGLKNVDQRLKLQFGEDYHMEIDAKENQYTEIKLYFPKSYSITVYS